MKTQHGFTLIELMIVIGIVAILSAIGLPTYQNYLLKAALTDMLHTMVPYKTAVELCTIEYGSPASCNAGSNGVPNGSTSRYVSDVTVTSGVITLSGQQSLEGLTVVLMPGWNAGESQIHWQRSCNGVQHRLTDSCNDIFRFDAAAETS